MSGLTGNPLPLGSLIKSIALAPHCDSCKKELGMWSLTSKLEPRRTQSLSIQISISCCALASVTLLDVRSLLVRPQFVIPVCGICSIASLRIHEPELSRTTESLILQGSNILQQALRSGS